MYANITFRRPQPRSRSQSTGCNRAGRPLIEEGMRKVERDRAVVMFIGIHIGVYLCASLKAAINKVRKRIDK